MMLARRVPAGMLFVPSIGGRSHHVSEDTRTEDIVTGAQVMAGAGDPLLSALVGGRTAHGVAVHPQRPTRDRYYRERGRTGRGTPRPRAPSPPRAPPSPNSPP